MSGIQTDLGKACYLKAGKFVSANDISENMKEGFYPCYGGNGIRGYVEGYTHDGTYPLIGRQGALCGNVNYASGKFHATEHAVVVQPLMDINVRWLYYKLLAMNLGQYATGAAQPGLAVSTLEKLPINIPEYMEQIKTAEMLDKVSGLIAMRKKQLQKLDDLVKSRFVEMFGNIPECEYMTMEEVCSLITDGTHQPPKFVKSGIPFLFVSNITGNKLTYDAEKYITEQTYAELIKRTPIEIGDILLSTVGSYGHPAVVKSERKFCFQRHIAYLKPCRDVIDSDYLHGVILSPIVQAQIEAKVRGIAQKTLNLSEIRKIHLPVAPMYEQRKFAELTVKVEESRLTIQRSTAKLELLKAALLQKYFG